ncbi:MAG: hypothetical protein LBD93_01160 [Treponema sp.]|nr:hypothetical protein [Treponema sp.]
MFDKTIQDGQCAITLTRAARTKTVLAYTPVPLSGRNIRYGSRWKATAGHRVDAVSAGF